MADRTTSVVLFQGGKVQGFLAQGQVYTSMPQACNTRATTASDMQPRVVNVRANGTTQTIDRQIVEFDDCVIDWTKVNEKVAKIASLKDGWDGYSAPAPNEKALRRASEFIAFLRLRRLLPSRVAPSVVGGVGMTFRRGARKVYVEFNNSGTLNALLSDGVADPSVVELPPIQIGFQLLIRVTRDFLNG